MEYQLKPLGKLCAATGQALVPGSRCHSVVVERQGQLLRLDYADTAWSGPPPDAIGHWIATVPAPKTTGRIDPEVLMRYFEQLSEEASPGTAAQRYVAALMLIRAKRLQLHDVRREDDAEFLLLEGMHGEGVFEVPNLQLPDADNAALQQQLKSQLATEWT